jgi:hypothetical protein
MALWSARKRGGPYIEPEDLLHALIREDRGEMAAIGSDVFPGVETSEQFFAGDHKPFLSDSVARTLLQGLHEQPEPLSRDPLGEKRQPAPNNDMPVSHSMKAVLALSAQGDQRKTIEPLDLLAAIAAIPDSRLANLLRDCGITPETLAKAMPPES